MRTIPDEMAKQATRNPTWRNRLSCAIGHHDWTSRTDLGIKPDKARIKESVVGYFFVFAAPVCRHCPRQLPPRTPT